MTNELELTPIEPIISTSLIDGGWPLSKPSKHYVRNPEGKVLTSSTDEDQRTAARRRSAVPRVVVECYECKANFALTDSNTLRHLYRSDGFMRWIEVSCSECGRHYNLFANHTVDDYLEADGVPYTVDENPEPYIRRMFYRIFYPDVDEREVSQFRDELESL